MIKRPKHYAQGAPRPEHLHEIPNEVARDVVYDMCREYPRMNIADAYDILLHFDLSKADTMDALQKADAMTTKFSILTPTAVFTVLQAHDWVIEDALLILKSTLAGFKLEKDQEAIVQIVEWFPHLLYRPSMLSKQFQGEHYHSKGLFAKFQALAVNENKSLSWIPKINRTKVAKLQEKGDQEKFLESAYFYHNALKLEPSINRAWMLVKQWKSGGNTNSVLHD